MEDMRRGECALCGFSTVIEFVPKSLVPGRGLVRTRYVPLAAAVVDPGSPEPTVGVGEIVLYACQACGFVQTFLSKPRALPRGEPYGTRLVKKVRAEK